MSGHGRNRLEVRPANHDLINKLWEDIKKAETFIAAIHRDWGEAQGNYDEFRFFTGMRPSEQIALLVTDFDIASGTLKVTKACVAGVDKDSTKTGEDRRITLCPRASDGMTPQLDSRRPLTRAGKS